MMNLVFKMMDCLLKMILFDKAVSKGHADTATLLRLWGQGRGAQAETKTKTEL